MDHNDHRFGFGIKFNYGVSSMQTESTKYNCRCQGASLSGPSAKRRKQREGWGETMTVIVLRKQRISNLDIP